MSTELATDTIEETEAIEVNDNGTESTEQVSDSQAESEAENSQETAVAVAPTPPKSKEKKKEKTVSASKTKATPKAEKNGKVATKTEKIAKPVPKTAPTPKAVLKAAKPVPKTEPREASEMRKAMSGIAGKFKMLGDATRLNILAFLVEETEADVTTICNHVHQSQPAVSHHLALLRHSGIAEPRREGKNNFYSLTELGQSLAEMISGLEA